jgi:hypothetical protein
MTITIFFYFSSWNNNNNNNNNNNLIRNANQSKPKPCSDYNLVANTLLENHQTETDTSI